MSVKRIHDTIHQGLNYAPEPVLGAALGATGGTVVGTVASAAALHTAGVTVGSVVATASTFGVATTATALGALAAPIMGPAIGCCAIYGACRGLVNWAKNDFKNPY